MVLPMQSYLTKKGAAIYTANLFYWLAFTAALISVVWHCIYAVKLHLELIFMALSMLPVILFAASGVLERWCKLFAFLFYLLHIVIFYSWTGGNSVVAVLFFVLAELAVSFVTLLYSYSCYKWNNS